MLKKNFVKPIFISRNAWNKVKLLYSNFKKHKYIKFISYDRNSTITHNLLKRKIMIRKGKGWSRKKISRWALGYKIGSLTWTRKPWKKREKRRPTKPKKR